MIRNTYATKQSEQFDQIPKINNMKTKNLIFPLEEEKLINMMNMEKKIPYNHVSSRISAKKDCH